MEKPHLTQGKSISEALQDCSDFIYSKGSRACSAASHQNMEPRGSPTPTQDVHTAQIGRWGLEQRKRHVPSFLLQTNQCLNSGKSLIVRLLTGNIHIKHCLSIAKKGNEGLGLNFHIMFCKHLGNTYCVAGYMLQRTWQMYRDQWEGSHPKPSWTLQPLELPRAGGTGGGMRCLGQQPTPPGSSIAPSSPTERPSRVSTAGL